MIGLEIVFDLGRYHANPWGSHVNDAANEWPPSPWRILRGLYSASRTHVLLLDRRADVDRAIEGLAQAKPPIFDIPPTNSGHTRHYMPVPEGSREKSTKVLDGFLAIDPRSSLRIWWDASLDAKATDALAATARALGYLGRSESVCTARLIAGTAPEQPTAQPLGSLEESSTEIEVIDLLCLDGQDRLTALTKSSGEIRTQRYALPPGTRLVPYAIKRSKPVPAAKVSKPSPHPQLALFRVRGGSRPPLHEAVAMGQLMRKALQSKFGSADGSSSWTFSGRAGDRRREDQHRHAHFLSLPDRHGRRIDRILVWADEGFDPAEVVAMASLRRLWQRDSDSTVELQVALGALGRRDELQLPVLLGPAKTWRSLTPFGLPRHPKVRAGKPVESPEEQVLRELSYRNFPSPETIEVDTGASWHSFRSSKIGQSRARRAKLVGVRLNFAQHVPGPIALGALSHYGLGLMQPDEAG